MRASSAHSRDEKWGESSKAGKKDNSQTESYISTFVSDCCTFSRTAWMACIRPRAFFAKMAANDAQDEFRRLYSRSWALFLAVLSLLTLAEYALQALGRAYISEYHFVHVPDAVAVVARAPFISNVVDNTIPCCLVLITLSISCWLVWLVTSAVAGSQRIGSRREFTNILGRVTYVVAANSLILVPLLVLIFLFQARNPSGALRALPLTTLIVMLLLLNACRGLSYCVPIPGNRPWLRWLSRWIGTPIAVVLAGVGLSTIYMLLARTDLFRDPLKEARIANNEYEALENIWTLKNGIIVTALQEGSLPAQTIEFSAGLNTHHYLVRYKPRGYGDFSLVGIPQAYGAPDSGRRSFFLDCTGGVIRGIDPGHQESFETSLVSPDSPIIASENDYYSQSKYKSATVVSLREGQKAFANPGEMLFVGSAVVRLVAMEADNAAKACASEATRGFDADEARTRIRGLANSAMRDLQRLQDAAQKAHFTSASEFPRFQQYIGAKVALVNSSCSETE